MVDETTSDNSALQTEESSESTPEFMTVKQFNAGLTAYKKQIQKENLSLVNEIKSLKEQLANNAPAEKPKAKAESADDAWKKEFQTKFENLLNERNAEKAKFRQVNLDAALKEKLLANGVDPKGLKAAMHYLKAENAVTYLDDSDDIVFRTESEDFDLDNGIKLWTQTEDAKFFIPAKGISGSGDKPKANETTVSPQKTMTSKDFLAL